MISSTSRHVNQRRDVHVRALAPFGADCHSHNRSPVSLLREYSAIARPLVLVVASSRHGGGVKVPAFLLIGQKSELIHARGANVVNHLDHPPELRSRIGFEKHALVGPVRQLDP